MEQYNFRESFYFHVTQHVIVHNVPDFYWSVCISVMILFSIYNLAKTYQHYSLEYRNIKDIYNSILYEALCFFCVDKSVFFNRTELVFYDYSWVENWFYFPL